MAKEQIIEITEWICANVKHIKELIVFGFVVVLGVIVKIIIAMKKGTKFTVAWFFSELVMSFFVAITVYAFFDQFLQVNKLFSYMMCAWCGTFSTLFHEKLKDFMEFIFETLKNWIRIKVK